MIPPGGPQAHELDLWRAGAPNIDLLCPDIQLPDVAGISAMHTQNNNALFVPESGAVEHGAGSTFYVIGKLKAIGYLSFGIERTFTNNENDPISKAYKILTKLAPLILDAQSSGTISSVLLTKEENQGECSKYGGGVWYNEEFKRIYNNNDFHKTNRIFNIPALAQ